MPILPTTNIGDWTVTILTKFLEDWFKNHPLPSVESLQVDNLTVAEKLDVAKAVAFDSFPIHVVGTGGCAPFEHGWSFYGAPYAKAAYWKDPLGRVHLLGVLAGGTVGASAFTLPPGFRPAVAPGPFIVFSGGATSVGRVDVGADGTVTPQLPSASSSVSLEGISFNAS